MCIYVYTYLLTKSFRAAGGPTVAMTTNNMLLLFPQGSKSQRGGLRRCKTSVSMLPGNGSLGIDASNYKNKHKSQKLRASKFNQATLASGRASNWRRKKSHHKGAQS